MARLDEIAEGLASVLKLSYDTEQLAVDMLAQSPIETPVLVRAVIDARRRNGTPIVRVHICPELGRDVELQLMDDHSAYQGVSIVCDNALKGRIEFFRFPQPIATDIG